MSDFETGLVVMTTFALGGMGVVGLVGWIVQHAVKTEAEGLHERADWLDGKTDEQSSRLASVSGELHLARADLADLKGLVEGFAERSTCWRMGRRRYGRRRGRGGGKAS